MSGERERMRSRSCSRTTVEKRAAASDSDHGSAQGSAEYCAAASGARARMFLEWNVSAAASARPSQNSLSEWLQIWSRSTRAWSCSVESPILLVALNALLRLPCPLSTLSKGLAFGSSFDKTVHALDSSLWISALIFAALVDDDDDVIRKIILPHCQTQHHSQFGKQSAKDCFASPTSNPSRRLPTIKKHFAGFWENCRATL